MNYVKNGGALLDASGPVLSHPMSLYYSPLNEVLPARPGEALSGKFKPQVTEIGRRHPVTAGLPGDGLPPSWGSWFRQTDVEPNPDSTVVMSGINTRPLLVLRPMLARGVSRNLPAIRSGYGRAASMAAARMRN